MGKLVKRMEEMLRIAGADISAVRIFKTRKFRKWAIAQKLKDSALKQAVQEIADGGIDANLGSGLIKQRVALGNRGKSGGVRVIIAYRMKEKFFFLHGFAKNEKSNIDEDESKALKALGAHLLSMSDAQIQVALDEDELYEVT